MNARPEKLAAEEASVSEKVLAFLEGELPPASRKQAPYFAASISEAAARYERYNARRADWIRYGMRRDHLEAIKSLAEDLVSKISSLDGLSRDDLARRLDRLDALVGSLGMLREEAASLANEVQRNGRARDLAEERWLAEVADIFENAFGRPAHVSGSGGGDAKRRGRFYDLLKVSRPASFLRYGKFHPRQIERVLKRRKRVRALDVW